MDKLTEPCSVLVFDTDGDNLVEFLSVGVPLAYSRYGLQFSDCLDVGCFCDSDASSVEEILSRHLQKRRRRSIRRKPSLLSLTGIMKRPRIWQSGINSMPKNTLKKRTDGGHYRKFKKARSPRTSTISSRSIRSFRGDKFHLDSRVSDWLPMTRKSCLTERDDHNFRQGKQGIQQTGVCEARERKMLKNLLKFMNRIPDCFTKILSETMMISKGLSSVFSKNIIESA